MNSDRLQQLRIDPAAKRRSQNWVVLLFLGVIASLAVTLYLAWPRKSDEVRLMSGAPASGSTRTEGGAARTTATATTNNAVAVGGRTESRVPGSLLTVSGYIVNRERIELSPRFMGVVKWIGVKKGDAVTNGQVVVLLDDAEYRARQAEAEARLANARVAVEKAELDFQRTRELVRNRVEMQKLEDDARLQLESARATVAEIEGQLQLVRTYLEWTVIKSPIDGVVLEKLVDPNELVTPQSFGGTRGPSTALIALADPKDLQVEIDLNESYLAKVYLGQKCKVRPEAYLDRMYDGYVAEIAPEASRLKGTLQIKVQIQAPDRFLTPELSASVDFLGPAEGERAPGG